MLKPTVPPAVPRSAAAHCALPSPAARCRGASRGGAAAAR